MGLLDFILKQIGFQNPFQTGTPGASGGSWEDHVTIEDIEAMEKKGIDTTDLRKKYEARKARAIAAKEALLAALDFDKLDEYKAIPRVQDSEFVQDVMKLNDWSKKYTEVVANAPLFYAAIVQANSSLWTSGDGEYVGTVVVFSPDPQYTYNSEWLTSLAKRVSEMKESNSVPDDCSQFIKKLRNDKSEFFLKLGNSLTDGVEAWATVFLVKDQKALPKSCLPANRMLPILIPYKLEELSSGTPRLEQIPAKYYTK